jgi:KipI family sensor histidine kinase inhibitor
MIDPPPFRIRAAGDSSLVVELEARIDPAINERVLAIGRALREKAADGVRDVVTTYHTVAVQFDPLRTRLDELIRDLEDAVRTDAPATTGTTHDVPVCYGGEYGPDLADVSGFAGCSGADVIALHSAPTYRVYMLGFVPGFAYMGIVHERIAMPRRATPRLRVPSGSVAIAGRQTGIYPAETPGGWQVIGRTPLRPFDASRLEPFLCQPGDLVRFVAVTAERFAELAAAS